MNSFFSLFISLGSDDTSSRNNFILEPEPTSALLFSPSTQIWNVDKLSQKEQTQLDLNIQGLFRSPGKWNISSINKPTDLEHVTKTLFVDESLKSVNGKKI